MKKGIIITAIVLASIALGICLWLFVFAPTPPGSISGKVIDGDGLLPIAGARLEVKTADGILAGKTHTASDGTYHVDELAPADDYVISAEADGYTGIALSNISVVSEELTGDVNFTLWSSTLGSISGYVLSITGSPVSDAVVLATVNGIEYGSAISDSDGAYTISRIEEGVYELSVEAEGFDGACFRNITVSAGQCTSSIDFSLYSLPGMISGRITASNGITPIQGIWICATEEGGKHRSTEARSNYNGIYLISNLEPGLYEINVLSTIYVPGTQPGVKVSGGEVSAGIDFSLVKTGSISGTIYASDGETPVPGAEITITGENNNFDSAFTDSSGAYIMKRLRPGKYEARITATGFNESTSSDIEVSPGVHSPDINFSLEELGAISRELSSSDGKTAITGALIQALGSSGGHGSTVSGSDGSYAIENLPPGNYELSAYVEGRLIASVKDVAVELMTVSNADLSAFAGTISVSLTEADGSTAISGATIYAVLAGMEGEIGFQQMSTSAVTSSDGTLQICNLQPGTYMVQTSAPGFGNSVKVITVADGITKLDFALGGPGSISGVVLQQQDNKPISRAEIEVFDADNNLFYFEDGYYTNTNGEYMVTDLAAGTYSVCVVADGFSTVTLLDVVISAGSDTGGTDFLLQAVSGSISGTIYKQNTKTPVEGALVIIASADFSNYVFTSADGSYRIDNLSTGTYTMVISAADCVSQIHKNISVVAEQPATGMDYYLDEE